VYTASIGVVETTLNREPFNNWQFQNHAWDETRKEVEIPAEHITFCIRTKIYLQDRKSW
jgi:hypothetical protein